MIGKTLKRNHSWGQSDNKAGRVLANQAYSLPTKVVHSVSFTSSDPRMQKPGIKPEQHRESPEQPPLPSKKLKYHPWDYRVQRANCLSYTPLIQVQIPGPGKVLEHRIRRKQTLRTTGSAPTPHQIKLSSMNFIKVHNNILIFII